MAIYSGFSHEKLWFSIAMLVHQRVPPTNIIETRNIDFLIHATLREQAESPRLQGSPLTEGPNCKDGREHGVQTYAYNPKFCIELEAGRGENRTTAISHWCELQYPWSIRVEDVEWQRLNVTQCDLYTSATYCISQVAWWMSLCQTAESYRKL